MKITTLLASAAACALFAGTAHAQTDGAAGQTAGDATGLDDIVVTAQRREENLQKAAAPVSAVTGDDLIAAGVSDTNNLTKLVPSLIIQPIGGSATSIYLRGVGTLQGNAFGENPVAFNFAGVNVARPNAPVGTFYDLERVEVVKGPQGTLYGRNATGGAINILPTKPEIGRLGGNLTAEYGNYNTFKVSGALNIPLGDSAAFRIAGQVVDRDGYSSQGYDDEVGQAFRASLLIKPDADWSIYIVGDYFHQGGKGQAAYLVPGAFVPNAPALDLRIDGSDPISIAVLTAKTATLTAPPFCGGNFVTQPYATSCVSPPSNDGFNDSKFYGISATVEGDLGFATLTIIPAWRRSEPHFRFYHTGFRGDVQESSEQYTLEARLTSNGDSRLQYVLGAYLFSEKQNAIQQSFFQGRISDTRYQPQLKADSQAVFGQLTFNVSDTFRVVGGARYTTDKRSMTSPIQLIGPFGLTTPVGYSVNGALQEDRVTWKAGIEADVGPRSLLYANVATGFKAGGFYAASNGNNTYNPESLTAYTVGSKNRFLDNTLQFNVEAFYWDYKDQQISFVGPVQIISGTYTAGGTTVNAGQGHMYGAEAELVFAPTSHDTFTANVQYLHAKYDSLKFVAISAGGSPIRSGCASTLNTSVPVAAPALLFQIDCSGMQQINAPEWTANLGYEHVFELGGDYQLVANARTRLETSRYISLEYLPELKQDGYMMSDASITLRGPDDRWAVTGFVNNIEDVEVLSSGISRPVVQTVYVSLRPPRTYGIRGTIKF
ncbi:MAG: TonB-dependent receptor [Sphingomonas sp.]